MVDVLYAVALLPVFFMPRISTIQRIVGHVFFLMKQNGVNSRQKTQPSKGFLNSLAQKASSIFLMITLGISLVLVIPNIVMLWKDQQQYNQFQKEEIASLSKQLKEANDSLAFLNFQLEERSFDDYFVVSEFDSKDKRGSGRNMQEEFKQKITCLREKLGDSIFINSGFRTPLRNKKAGGADRSAHKEGLAADIKCTNNEQRYFIIKAALDCGFNRIGISDRFIHVDCKHSERENLIWLYD